MSIASDGMNNWRGELSIDIFPIEAMKLNNEDMVHLRHTFEVYPLANEQTRLEKPIRYAREESYDIAWDDTGESILHIVELSENQ